MTQYSGLTDEAKLELCIEFVAYGVPMPPDLHEFLMKHKLVGPVERPKVKCLKKRNLLR